MAEIWKKILFLDDRSKRIHAALTKFPDSQVTIVTNVKECLHMLCDYEWAFVYLDHDLGGDEFCDPDRPDTGMEIVRYLEKTAWPPEFVKPIFIIHSSNQFAAYAMELRLRALGFSARRERFTYA